MEPGDHLFRQESGRMVATLTRIFGVHNLPLVEDVVQDAFCRALEVWKFRGPPPNPAAWLMATAKNRALDILRREATARRYAPELGKLLESEWTLASTVNEFFEPQAIRDDVLRMTFSCCQPEIPEIAQIALVLHLVCGFSVREVASAFLCSDVAMEKRIGRAKKTLAQSTSLFDFTAESSGTDRLPAVHRAIYLLFNEGFHGASSQSVIRRELCAEAIRLGDLLLDHPTTARPATYALAALMCLHAARLPARLNSAGDLLSLVDQDRSKWDQTLISRGHLLLATAATGTELSEFHLEAAIASVHARAASSEATDWPEIVALYGILWGVHPSPVVALNRAIAVGQAQGPERGLQEIESIADADRLKAYPFYWAALGEFELRQAHLSSAQTESPQLESAQLESAQLESAKARFATALKLARNVEEKRFLKRRIDACRRREA